MLTKLQSVDIDIKRKGLRISWISLGWGNGIRCAGTLGAGWEWSSKDHMGETGWRMWVHGEKAGVEKEICEVVWKCSELETPWILWKWSSSRLLGMGDIEHQLTIPFSQAMLPVEGLGCIQLSCWPTISL